ncbi:GNAT family N-acetyltransferase [Namhaeicola litoreus]|uniref:GNAT family N-acetyltransferase n=1 Tax=Namhaeicola litoreus TaxID=1052145 RepID=A0ABW3Y023_9FLAO
MMLKFRKAEIKDQSHLNQISLASKKYWGYPDEWIEQWKDDLFISIDDITQNTVQVAQFKEKIIGFCSVSEEGDFFEIDHLWILPEFVGKGYGKKLLDYTLGLVSHSTKPIQVVSDPNAEGFYKKSGFITIGKIESYPPGRFLPLMRKI